MNKKQIVLREIKRQEMERQDLPDVRQGKKGRYFESRNKMVSLGDKLIEAMGRK